MDSACCQEAAPYHLSFCQAPSITLLGKTNGVLTQRTQSGAEADLKIVRGN